VLSDKEIYSKFLEYMENNIDFEFLSNIPGYDKDYEAQKKSILKLIKSSRNNERFLDYASYTYSIFKSGIIRQILSITWMPSNGINGIVERFINDDKFGLDENQLVNYISLLLVIRDVMHTSYIASLPIYNEYKYDGKEFYDKAKDMIENSVDNISTLGNINPIFAAIAAKSILPYSIRNDELSSSSKLIAILFNVSRIVACYPYSEKNAYNTRSVFLSAIYNLVNNSSFLGLDYKMMKELYRRAKSGEIFWKN